MTKGLVIGVGLGVALLALFLFRGAQRLEAAKASGVVAETPAVRVKGAKVQRRDLAREVAITGQVRPKNEVEIFPKVAGRVQAVRVQVGDRVRAGQTLAVLEHEELAWQAKGARAAAQLAAAALAQAKDELRRAEALSTSGGIADAALTGARNKAAVAEAQLAQAEAQAGLAATALANATITAPIAGVVTRKGTDVGAMVGPAVSLFQVQDAAELKLEATVEADEALHVKPGQPVTVAVEAIAGETFAGQVAVVSPTLDPKTRRAAIEVAIPNAAGRLLPNMFARGTIRVGTVAGVLAVPRAAVFESATGRAVYAVRDGTATMVRPAFGPGDADHLAVEAGLAEGDVVATDGLGLLADGARAVAEGE